MKLLICLCAVFFCSVTQAGQFQSAKGTPIPADRFDDLINSLMKTENVPGLTAVVVNQNQLVYSQVYGVKNQDTKTPVVTETVFETASISKPVFAMFAMKMIEQGVIDLDTPLHEFYPYPDIQALHASNPEAKSITARMVLTHTSGLPNWRFFNEDGKLNLLSKPGETYSYSGEGYEYLAAVLAHRLNVDYSRLNALIIKTIFKPLSMNTSSFMLLPELRAVKANAHEEGKANPDLSIGFASYFGAAYGLHSTGSDFANLLIELNQQTLLPKSLYEAYLTPATAIPEDDSINNEFGYHSFGLGILIGDTAYGTKYAHGGMNPGFQGFFVVIPDAQFGFAFFGNSDTAINMLPAIEACLVEGEC